MYQGNPKHKCRLGEEWIERSSKEKELDMLVDKKFKITQQCSVAEQKSNFILSCSKRGVVSRAREVRLSLYFALERPHLESCIQLWLQHKDISLLERVQRRAVNMIRGMQQLS